MRRGLERSHSVARDTGSQLSAPPSGGRARCPACGPARWDPRGGPHRTAWKSHARVVLRALLGSADATSWGARAGAHMGRPRWSPQCAFIRHCPRGGWQAGPLAGVAGVMQPEPRPPSPRPASLQPRVSPPTRWRTE